MREDEPATQAHVGNREKLNRQYIQLAEYFVAGVRTSSIMVMRRHISEPRDMEVKRDGELVLVAYESVPNDDDVTFRGYPERIVMSSARGQVASAAPALAGSNHGFVLHSNTP